MIIKEKSFAQDVPAKITTGECFFDVDPGVGNGSPIVVSTADSISLNLNFAANGLGGGFHQLFVRFKDANNLWSIAEQRTFYIDSAVQSIPSKLKAGEYFFDKDPGAGKATKLGAINTDSINKLYSLSTTALKGGFHQLFIRYKDATNNWSVAGQRAFYIDKDSSLKPSPIIAAEYFFTKNKGKAPGQGTPLVISKTDSINQTFNITVPNLPTGKQYLEIRFKDSSGKWSIAESRKITIVNGFITEDQNATVIQEKHAVELNVYPNPTTGNTYLIFNALKEEKLSIMIIDASGKTLLKKEIVTAKGANKILLDLSRLIPGDYLVNMINETHEQQTLKIIKQ